MSGGPAQRTQRLVEWETPVSLVPQVSQSKLIWTRDLIIHHSQLLPAPCILWMACIFTLYLCQVLHVALFLVPSGKWKVSQRQGVDLLPLVSLGILALTSLSPASDLARYDIGPGLWALASTLEITKSNCLIFLRRNWGPKLGCDILNITQPVRTRAWISPWVSRLFLTLTWHLRLLTHDGRDLAPPHLQLEAGSCKQETVSNSVWILSSTPSYRWGFLTLKC